MHDRTTVSEIAPGVLAGFRALSPPARLLVVNGFGISLGFFLVMPFLAGYLRDDLGLGAALVGTVIGVRTLCQQGLFLVGGSAADRLGPRPMILAGCGLRTVAFGLYAATTSVPGIVAGTVLIGVAGALFSPAARTYLLHEAADRRAEAFVVYEVVGNAGTLIGPLLGAVLLTVDFRLMAAVAAVIFAVLTVAQAFVLPPRAPTAATTRLTSNWAEVVTNRQFLAFTIAGSAYFALFNQLYLALPLEAQRVTGHQAAVAGVFLTSTLVSILFGVRLVAACRRHWSSATAMAAGLVALGLGFVPLGIAAPLLGTAADPLEATDLIVPGVVLVVGTALFAVGTTLTSPFMMDLLPVVGSERLVGTYYGFFYLVSAVVAAVVSALVGRLLDLDAAELRWIPFVVLALIGLLGAAGIAALGRHLTPVTTR